MRRNIIVACVALCLLALLGVLTVRSQLATMLLAGIAGPTEAEQKPASKRIAAVEAAAVPRDNRPVATPAAPKPSSSFDVVRIDPEGASVFAGRAPANSEVTVVANDTAIATAKANDEGQWATVIERRFASGSYQLSLKSKPEGAATAAPGQAVSITIASTAKPEPVLQAGAVVPHSPAPILFPYNEADITGVGQAQAAALRDFLRQQKPEIIILSGHADARGTDDYNMELSRNRLERVSRFLRSAGYTGKIELVAKGAREPFVSADRDKLPKEEVFQLDRRVEVLRWAQ